MPRAARALALLALACPLGACDWPPKPVNGTADAGGSVSTPPTGTPSPAVIDELDLSPNAQATHGQYDIYGSISFHDDHGTVHLIRVRVPVINRAYDFPAGDAAVAYGLAVDFVVSADLPLGGAGPTNFSITLVDQDGHESSPPLIKSVDLQ